MARNIQNLTTNKKEEEEVSFFFKEQTSFVSFHRGRLPLPPLALFDPTSVLLGCCLTVVHALKQKP